MQQDNEYDGIQELYLAGERVKPGTYRQIGADREICIDREDFLPASLDGRVACYMKVSLWGHMARSLQNVLP